MSNVSAGIAALGNNYTVSNFASGTYIGDGTAGSINVRCGFTPRYVRVDDITAGVTYEWEEGLPATNTIKTTWASGVRAIDTNGYIVTNMVLATATEVAYPAPGAQSPDDGVNATTTVTYESPNKAVAQLSFVAGASGAGVNVNNDTIVWHALG